MRLMTKSMLFGMGAVALTGAAVAAERAVHTLNVQLPDGSIEHIHYIGDTPPNVEVVPVSAATPAMPIAFADPFGGDFSFAAFDQMFRQMDMQAAAMMQRAAALSQMPVTADGKIDQAALKQMPAGTVSYTYVSTTTGNGTCTKSVEYTSYGNQAQPKVVSQTSGGCSGAPALNQPMKQVSAPARPAPAVPARPRTVSHDTV